MDWFYDLPVVWMAVFVFAGMALVNLLVYGAVMTLAARGWGPAFKATSPVMLTPLAVVFGLIVGFLAAQDWADAERANSAVAREASALHAVNLLAASFPGESRARIQDLVRHHIRHAVDEEWPAMARQTATLAMITPAETEAIELTLAVLPRDEAQTVAQRELVAALRSALDARRERIIISKSRINAVKWTVVLVLAGLIMVTIAFVHSDNKATAAMAMTIFSIGAAACVVLIASHTRPFTGEVSISPELLLQAMPKAQ